MRFVRFVTSDRMAAVMAAGAAVLFLSAAVLSGTDDNRIGDTLAAEQREAEESSVIVSVAPVQPLTEAATTGQTVTEIPCAWAPFTISREDFELTCRTVYAEAGNQDIVTQVMVALTVFNRLSSSEFPDTVAEVIYQADQYEVTGLSDFKRLEWTDSVEQAVTCALEYNGHPQNMYYFRTAHYHGFGVPYLQSGDLFFSTEEQKEE